LEANPDKIDWNNLSYNLAAIHLLEANQDKIHWDRFCLKNNDYKYYLEHIKKYEYILK